MIIIPSDSCSKFIAVLSASPYILGPWNKHYGLFLAGVLIVTCLVNMATVITIKLFLKRPSSSHPGISLVAGLVSFKSLSMVVSFFLVAAAGVHIVKLLRPDAETSKFGLHLTVAAVVGEEGSRMDHKKFGNFLNF